jgi:nicotinamidase/pyrazinamidase
MARNALVLVDVQNDFCPGGALAVAGGDEIVPVLNRLIGEFKQAGMPVIATRDWHPARTVHFNTSGGIWPPHCVRDTRGAEFYAGLDLDRSITIVSKGLEESADSYSGFDGVDARGVGLADLLRRLGVERLVIGGLATDYCVKQTALDGLRNGFKVTVLEDAVRGVDVKPGDATQALDDMKRAGALIRASKNWAVH